mmetsp:Transcript_4863/g.12217  ORF Transcript_4863/g.12217 Transcript_4863/m.12217 type:complete len:316 (-) Transcript_4863:592-1539(-)
MEAASGRDHLERTAPGAIRGGSSALPVSAATEQGAWAPWAPQRPPISLLFHVAHRRRQCLHATLWAPGRRTAEWAEAGTSGAGAAADTGNSGSGVAAGASSNCGCSSFSSLSSSPAFLKRLSSLSKSLASAGCAAEATASPLMRRSAASATDSVYLSRRACNMLSFAICLDLSSRDAGPTSWFEFTVPPPSNSSKSLSAMPLSPLVSGGSLASIASMSSVRYRNTRWPSLRPSKASAPPTLPLPMPTKPGPSKVRGRSGGEAMGQQRRSISLLPSTRNKYGTFCPFKSTLTPPLSLPSELASTSFKMYSPVNSWP